MEPARHELTAIDGERSAEAIVRRATTLGWAAAAAMLLAILAQVPIVASLGLVAFQFGGVGVASVLVFLAGRRLVSAKDLRTLSRWPGARAALVGDDLEIVTPARTLRLPATRAELRRLGIRALPAARVHERR